MNPKLLEEIKKNTAQSVQAVQKKSDILDTHKAMPGSRYLQKYAGKHVKIETLEIFEEALKHQPTAILFDNLSPGEISKAAKLNLERIYLKASGTIKLSNPCSYADRGVHKISIGALTHSIKAIDMSLEIT